MAAPTRDTEFVITRKRKRQTAIDPCLGFYSTAAEISLQPPVLAVEDASCSVIEDAPPVTSGWTVLPKDPPNDKSDVTYPDQFSTPSNSGPVTVEAFLRSYARRVHIQKYGRRFRNRRIIRSSSSPPSENDCVDQLDEDDCPRSSKIQSLLDPKHYGSTTSAAKLAQELDRPALTFLPLKALDKAAHVRPKLRPIRLWGTARNGKTGVPFRTSSFSGHEKKTTTPSEPMKQRPLNTWSTFRKSTSQSVISNKPSKVTVNRRRPSRCAPLSFVPLADAEKSYDKKFHAANTNKRDAPRQSQMHSVAPLILVPATSPAYTPKPLEPCSPSAIISSPRTSASSSVFPQAAQEPLPTLKRLLLTVTPPTQATYSDAQCAHPDTYTAQYPSPALGSEEAPSSSDKNSSGKRLKPLRSFFGGFIERVRTATQREAAATSHSDHPTRFQQGANSFGDSCSAFDQLTRPDHGLNQVFATSYHAEDRMSTAENERARRTRRARNSTAPIGRGENNYLNDTNPFHNTSLDLLGDDTGSSAQAEFPPYVPPATPFDINTALLLYTQAADSGIRLGFSGSVL